MNKSYLGLFIGAIIFAVYAISLILADSFIKWEFLVLNWVMTISFFCIFQFIVGRVVLQRIPDALLLGHVAAILSLIAYDLILNPNKLSFYKGRGFLINIFELGIVLPLFTGGFLIGLIVHSIFRIQAGGH